MTKIVQIIRRYPYPPEQVWSVVADWPSLQRVSEPLLRYTGLPSGRFEAGQDVGFEVSLCGLFNPLKWRTNIVELDGARMLYRTHESGGAFRRWDHEMTITADGEGAVMRDYVEVDAGRQSWLAALWVRKIYAFRHRMRRRRLRAMARAGAAIGAA